MVKEDAPTGLRLCRWPWHMPSRLQKCIGERVALRLGDNAGHRKLLILFAVVVVVGANKIMRNRNVFDRVQQIVFATEARNGTWLRLGGGGGAGVERGRGRLAT